MRIQDFCDMKKFEEIMSNWAKSTGLATVAVGDDGLSETSVSDEGDERFETRSVQLVE